MKRQRWIYNGFILGLGLCLSLSSCDKESIKNEQDAEAYLLKHSWVNTVTKDTIDIYKDSKYNKFYNKNVYYTIGDNEIVVRALSSDVQFALRSQWGDVSVVIFLHCEKNDGGFLNTELDFRRDYNGNIIVSQLWTRKGEWKQIK